jgi:2'-5' RNA ligase
MTDHFNVALLPEDDNFALACVDFAQANFSERASEYLLGTEAFPHVTLCQFEIETELKQLRTLWLAMESLQRMPISLKLGHIYFKPGVETHENKYWVGLAVEKIPRLSALQNSVYEQLAHFGIQGKTLPQTYFPHLTWARCDYDKPLRLAFMPPEDFWKNDYLFAISLGRSDENGVYHERIYPALG